MERSSIKGQKINSIVLVASIIIFTLVTLWIILSFANQNDQDHNSMSRYSTVVAPV